MTDWPELPFDDWRETRETIHRWMQIVGKIRLGLTPTINHWWNVPLYVTARGFTTSAIPYGDRWFEIEFDFLDDRLRITPNDRAPQTVRLGPRTVASFYAETMSALRAAGIACRIWPVPVEIEDPIRFDQDDQHGAYDKPYVLRFWRVVALATAALAKFRARFVGKCSPVQFYWGTFDLAVSRFSGRPAPAHEGGVIEQEAYSHEVSSVGWWPGDRRLPTAAFYSYAYPEPAGFGDAAISTPHAYYHPQLKGFYLHYDDMRRAAHPAALLLDFCEHTYAAAADLGRWDRAQLERTPPGAEQYQGELRASPDAGGHAGADAGLQGMHPAGR